MMKYLASYLYVKAVNQIGKFDIAKLKYNKYIKNIKPKHIQTI